MEVVFHVVIHAALAVAILVMASRVGQLTERAAIVERRLHLAERDITSLFDALTRGVVH